MRSSCSRKTGWSPSSASTKPTCSRRWKALCCKATSRSELAGSAFSEYLKGLDLRARLDIVASYLDQDLTNPGVSTLHVLGRTYGTSPQVLLPHLLKRHVVWMGGGDTRHRRRSYRAGHLARAVEYFLAHICH